MPKPGPDDTIPALLSPGEHVLNLGAVALLGGGEFVANLNKLGLGLMQQGLNLPRQNGYSLIQGFEDGTLEPQGATPAPVKPASNPSAPIQKNFGGTTVFKQGNSYSQFSKSAMPIAGKVNANVPTINLGNQQLANEPGFHNLTGDSKTLGGLINKPSSLLASSPAIFKNGNSYSQFDSLGATEISKPLTSKLSQPSLNQSNQSALDNDRAFTQLRDFAFQSLRETLDTPEDQQKPRPRPSPITGKPPRWRDIDEEFKAWREQKALEELIGQDY